MHIEEKKHAVLGMSGADRWVLCPGSVKMESYYPNTSSKYADWGTAAHELADICLKSGEDAEDHLNRTFFVGGNPYQVDMEMADCVNTYIGYVQQYINVDAGDILMTEEIVPIDHITGEEDAEGTSDVIGITREGKRIVVIDLKTGQGVKVDAFAPNDDGFRPAVYDPKTCTPNRQMTGYAGGALRKYAMIYDGIEEVEIVIIQPRIHWVDSIIMTMEDFQSRVDALSVAAGIATIDDGQTLVAGEKQCKFCRYKTCPAKAALALEPVTKSKASPASVFANLDQIEEPAANGRPEDGEAIAKALRAFPIIKMWMDGIIEERDRRMTEGLGVPGFKYTLGDLGDRKWIDEDAALKALTVRGRLKVDEATKRKVISPTQAEKLLKKRPEIWGKVVQTEVGGKLLITRADRKPIIVPADDPREEYKIASSADVFENLSTDEQDTATVSPTLASLLE